MDLFLKENLIIILVLCVIIAALCFTVYDGIFSMPTSYEAKVLAKHFTPGGVQHGTGTFIGTDGNMGITNTTSVSEDKYLIVAMSNDAQIIHINCEAELYYAKELNDKIHYKIYRGKFTNWVWSIEGFK